MKRHVPTITLIDVIKVVQPVDVVRYNGSIANIIIRNTKQSICAREKNEQKSVAGKAE